VPLLIVRVSPPLSSDPTEVHHRTFGTAGKGGAERRRASVLDAAGTVAVDQADAATR
jgi:hypothetical protein